MSEQSMSVWSKFLQKNKVRSTSDYFIFNYETKSVYKQLAIIMTENGIECFCIENTQNDDYDLRKDFQEDKNLFFFAEFPFDLPLPLSESNPSSNATARDGPPPVSETNVHKSLPDFLSDGPIHNRATDPEPVAGIAESGERRVNL